MIIDAHHHLWAYNDRDYVWMNGAMGRLRRDFLPAHAEEGWVPLVDPGVRHVLHDEPDELYMLRGDFNRGVSLLKDFGLNYDLLIFERHLPQTIQFVDRHPNQTFIVDHIAKPRIKDRAFSPWREGMHELARRANVYCKLSGMVTEADWNAWTIEGLKPYFEIALSAFGPNRLMFGSDWPVLTLIVEHSPHEQARIRGRTAIEAYHL